MGNPSLIIRIAASVEQLKATLAETKTEISAAAGAMAQAAETSSQAFQARWASVTVAAGAAAAGIKGVATEVEGWLQAASESENATARLTTALQAQGRYTPELLQQYTALAGELQRTSIHADDVNVEMMAMLTQVGHVAPEQMGAALQAAMDLSAGLKTDLPAATQMLAKALGTGGESLGRLKGVLGNTTIEGEGTAAMLGAINTRFGGQAQAQAQTYAGKMTIVKNQWGEMEEKAGELLARVLIPLMDWFLNMPASMQSVIATAGLLVGVLTPLGIAFAGISSTIGLLIPVLSVALPAAWAAVSTALAAIVPYLGPAGLIAAGIGAWIYVFQNLDVFIWAAVTAWQALKTAFQSAATAITTAAKEAYDGVKTWLSDRFTAVVDSIKSKVDAVTGVFKGMYDAVVGQSYVPDMLAGIEASFATLETVMVAPTEAATAQVNAAMEATTATVERTTQAVGSWSEAMAQVGRGLGTMGGEIAAPMDTAAVRADIQRAWNERRYYGPVTGGTRENPRGTGPDWDRIFGRALGGPVMPNQRYLVGERGPEIFEPDRPGTIIPNASTMPTVNITINGSVLADKHEIARVVGESLMGVLRSQGVQLPVGA